MPVDPGCNDVMKFFNSFFFVLHIGSIAIN